MAKKTNDTSPSLPIAGMVIMGILSAVVIGASFDVIRVWPQPQSVEPYFGFEVGAWWGLIVGAVVGLVIGFLTDDKHFQQDQSNH